MTSFSREYTPLPDETDEEHFHSMLVIAIAATKGGTEGIRALRHLGVERHWPVVEPVEPAVKKSLWTKLRGR